MVLVEPPAGGVAPPASGSSAGRRGKTEPGDESLEALLSAPNPQLADTVPDPVAQQIPLAAPPKAVAEPAEPAAPVAPAASPALPSSDWASHEARQMRQWLMIGAAAIAVAVLVIVGIGLWLARTPPSGPPLAQGPDAAPVDPALAPGASENPQDDAGASGGGSETEPQSPPGGTAPAATPPTDAVPSVPAPGTGTPGAAEPDSPAIPGATPADPTANPGPAAEPPADPPSTPMPPPSNPPGAATPTAPSPIVGARAGLSADAVLKEFEGLMSDSTFDRGAARSSSLYDLIPEPGRPFDMTRAMPKPPPLRTVNVDAQLGIRIPQLEFTGVPLHDFLQFAGDFLNLPITIDIDGLHRLGVPVMTPVNVMLTEADLRTGLAQALDPLGLELKLDGNHLLVLPRDVATLEERTYDVFDLVGEDPEAIQFLSDVILKYLAPSTWEANGGPGKFQLERGRLTIQNSPLLQHEVLMLCERLRIARGDRPQGALPPYMLDLQPRVGLALTPLGANVAADFATPVRLTEILRQLSETSGLQFVVNWHALQSLGWNPAALARLELPEASLSETLQELLGPLELSFRVIDATTIQITTAKEVFQTLDIELFRVAKAMEGDDGARLTRGVRTILGDPTVTRDAAGAAQFDVRSKTLIVVAPQNRIAAIARLIDQLEEAAGPAPKEDVLPVIE